MSSSLISSSSIAHILESAHDYIVDVTEYEDGNVLDLSDSEDDLSTLDKPRKVIARAKFYCRKEVLVKMPAFSQRSKTFFQAISGSDFKGASTNHVELEDSVKAFEVILRLFHDNSTDDNVHYRRQGPLEHPDDL